MKKKRRKPKQNTNKKRNKNKEQNSKERNIKNIKKTSKKQLKNEKQNEGAMNQLKMLLQAMLKTGGRPQRPKVFFDQCFSRFL